MRTWRITETGEVKDALLCEDTFCLTLTDYIGVGISYEKTPEESRKDYEIMEKLLADKFDYACIWKGFVFPVKHRETLSLDALQRALKDRQNTGLCFFWWKK